MHLIWRQCLKSYTQYMHFNRYIALKLLTPTFSSIISLLLSSRCLSIWPNQHFLDPGWFSQRLHRPNPQILLFPPYPDLETILLHFPPLFGAMSFRPNDINHLCFNIYVHINKISWYIVTIARENPDPLLFECHFIENGCMYIPLVYQRQASIFLHKHIGTIPFANKNRIRTLAWAKLRLWLRHCSE